MQTSDTMAEAQNRDEYLAREIYRVKREIEQCALFSRQQAAGLTRTRNTLARINDATTQAAVNGGFLTLAAAIGRFEIVKPLLGATCLMATIPLLLVPMSRDDEGIRMHAWFADRVSATSARIKSIEESVTQMKHADTETIRAIHNDMQRCHTDLVEAATLIKSFPMAKVFGV